MAPHSKTPAAAAVAAAPLLPRPAAQDHLPPAVRRASVPRLAKTSSPAAAFATEGDELDVDAPPPQPADAAAPADPGRAVVTGPVPADFHGLPPFSLKELRDCVPAHCFQRSFWRSFAYVVLDGVLLALCYAGMHALSASPRWAAWPLPLRVALWALWGFLTGIFGTGWWVLAHECGHHAFSPSAALDNLVGYTLHTILLVPYYSWQISHAKHHHHTAHMFKDQVFVPLTRSQMGLKEPADGVRERSEKEAIEVAALGGDVVDHDELETPPIVHVAKILIMWTLGWPGYLLWNAAGQEFPGRWVSHFNPSSPIFDGVKNGPSKVVASDIGVIAMLGLLAYLAYTFSFAAVFKWYLYPWLWVNFWLVTITFLQHTHPSIPHYRPPTWTFALGALATVDRSYGAFLNFFLHGITDTHVAHHLFSQMPHYHAREATEHLKTKLGKWYVRDDTPVLLAVWRSWTECRFVEDEGDVLFFRK